MKPLKPLSLAATLLLSVVALTAAERKPNFLFIYTDDQRWDAMSVVQQEQGEKGRYPWFKTPNMDRIANEGVRFRNAFVTMSLCAPSRTVFLTGRYNHLNGVFNNHTPFPEDNVSHARVLGAAGYKTAYFGKWHMGNQRGKRPGFDYSASFIGQGKYFDCPIEVNGEPTPSKGWVDDVTTQYAIDFMRKNKDQPFDVVIGLKSCHGPTEPPERAKNRFEGAKACRVPNLGATAIYRSPGEGRKANATPDDLVTINVNYFRCVSASDDNVGQLLKALDDLGLAQDTVVIFASDNGYYHGEHSLGDKRSGYDESLRIPMLLRYPRMITKPRVIDEMVLNLDLAPTLLDLAGQKTPTMMQGKSWKPLLAGTAGKWRDAFLFEYFYEKGFANTPTLVGVRTDTAKLVNYPGHEEWTELFDLRADPFELKNLARDPASAQLLAAMQARYDQEVKATQFAIPANTDKPGDPGDQPVAKKKSGKKKKAAAE